MTKYNEFNFRPYETHMLVYNLIQSGRRVLDIGCSSGYFAKQLQQKSCEVWGVDSDKKAITEAQKYCQKGIVGDLESPECISLPSHSFDYVLMLDVLEHIVHRKQLLLAGKQWLKPQGTLIVSTPNVAHIRVRFKLLLGDFSYEPYGILDESHVHLYTKQSLINELHSSGWRIDKLIPSADFGQLPVAGKWLRYIPKPYQYGITKAVSTLVGVQWIASCRSESS